MVDKIWYNMEELIGGSEERGINRNILECKCPSTVSVDGSHTCINRNILECKFIIQRRYSIMRNGINRNILECK